MEAPPTRRLRFRWSWRPYQRRVLDTVDRHLGDGRLHIVAAPGAGKTTLGLEVFRRLGKPTLALAPTLTIRDQWLGRLRDFVPDPASASAANWIAQCTSTDLRAPAFLTVTTYQALLSRSRKDKTVTGSSPSDGTPEAKHIESFVALLRDAAVGTVILDEAHHLRNEWWKVLERVVAALDDVTLVSLTATPPYDATGHEWRRYEELCGPIDDHISVPELVKSGTLCPHQDFVYAVEPTERESSGILRHESAVDKTLSWLLDDSGFQREIESHPWVASASPDAVAVLDRPEVAVALLSYLQATSAGLPPPLMRLLELHSGELPALNRRWWQVLLQEYLHGSTFAPADGYRRNLARRLRDAGLLWRRTLRIERSRAVERLLAASASKVDACVQIHRREREVRGDDLRQVVLTDFIRDEALQATPAEAPADLGALPVFDALTADSERPDPTDVALVSGRLAIIHASRTDTLAAMLADASELRLSALPHRTGWIRVEGVDTGPLVAAFTRLLSNGSIRVLIGTRSLLGEGWDAPSINSLVLASYVGAFVSTNQMRGRAIRTDPDCAEKVASVWHIVAVSPQSLSGILDFDQLRARFNTFVGLSADARSIESGLGRLDLPEIRDAADLTSFNGESLARLTALPEIAEGWRTAAGGRGSAEVAPTVRFRRPPTLAPLHVRRTLRYVLYETAGAVLLGIAEAMRSVAAADVQRLGSVLLVGAAIPMVALTPRLYRAARLAIRHAPVDGSLAQIGRALLDALRAVGLLEGEDLSVRTERLADGAVDVSLVGGSFHDQSVFAAALAEILGPVANPRYLITRPSSNVFGRRVDFHAVPHELGVKRERAEALHAAWLRYVGDGDLIYTRREGGRTLLLAARARAFSNQFNDASERLDRWH